MSSTQIRTARILIYSILLGSFVLVLYGYFEHESEPEANERVQLFNDAFKNGYIAISQSGSGQPLEANTLAEFIQLKPADQQRYGKDRWEKMRRQTFRFIGAVNQGLGDPFEYRKDIEDRGVVEKIKEETLRYRNPFEAERAGPVKTPINSSEIVAENRPGWRIIGKDLVLYLKPGAPTLSLDAGANYKLEVGGEFVLASRTTSGASLRIRTQGDGKLQSLVLDTTFGENRESRQSSTVGDREYFTWDGQPFAVYQTNSRLSDANDPTGGDLVFSKVVNGRPTRVQVLGRTTANLIGSPVGGEVSGIDGAFLHNMARRLVLTIDPEIQVGSYFALAHTLRKQDAEQRAALNRPRKGAVTVLDVETGQILAQVGAPGYDPMWEAGRVILANRSQIIANPANELHMPGSAVKILTAGVGYLLFGDGRGDMLPTSINKLAIQQAFRNTYGGSMPPDSILTSEGTLVQGNADQYFREHGGQTRLNRNFLNVLNSGFYVMENKPSDDDVLWGPEPLRKELYEQIAGDLDGYFSPLGKYQFFPLRSRFPVRDADSIDLFRQLAIGGNETKFTTLRLAAVLATVSTNRVIHPFIVESVFNPAAKSKDDRVSYNKAKVFSELGAALPDVEGAHNGNDRQMTEQMIRYLQQVCIRGRGHTGYHVLENRQEVFMTEDDPSTTEMDEASYRRGDLGKTGTADYGSIDSFDDSVFVYKHGRFIVAVWLERADGGGTQHPANKVANQIVRLIDQLERRPA